MFACAAEQIRDCAEMLSQLDTVGGDGDHGATMVRAIETLESAFDSDCANSPSAMLKEAGWSAMNVDGGASSALFGTFISGMGDEDIGDQLDCQHLAQSLQAGLRAVCARTKAKCGDKTLMDALIPAVDAFHTAASAGKAIATAMGEAADAADRGAASTKGMIARYGRARNLGDRTLGHMDPGAASISLLFKGFSIALAVKSEGLPAAATGRSAMAKQS